VRVSPASAQAGPDATIGSVKDAEQLFATYLDSHGYAWKREPDGQAELGLATPLATKPDFLIERGRERALSWAWLSALRGPRPVGWRVPLKR